MYYLKEYVFLTSIVFFLIVNPLQGQYSKVDKVEGEYIYIKKKRIKTDSIPIGKHSRTGFSSLKYELNYSKKGLLQDFKIFTENYGYRVGILPKKLRGISWTKIDDGLWVHKIKSDINLQYRQRCIRNTLIHLVTYLPNGKIVNNTFIRGDRINVLKEELPEGLRKGIESMYLKEFKLIKISPDKSLKENNVLNLPLNTPLIFYVYVVV